MKQRLEGALMMPGIVCGVISVSVVVVVVEGSKRLMMMR
jgi:hypothetical protein